MPEIPPEFLAAMADLTSHKIEGTTREGNMEFSCPLVSQIDGNLWSGGCPTMGLPSYFRFVVNLYPWERYAIADPSTTVLVARLFDDSSLPIDGPLIEAIAGWVNAVRKIGPVLVHCQAGLNRSGLVTALALVRGGMTVADAISLMQARRSPAVLSNAAFATWLRANA